MHCWSCKKEKCLLMCFFGCSEILKAEPNQCVFICFTQLFKMLIFRYVLIIILYIMHRARERGGEGKREKEYTQGLVALWGSTGDLVPYVLIMIHRERRRGVASPPLPHASAQGCRVLPSLLLPQLHVSLCVEVIFSFNATVSLLGSRNNRQWR